MTVKYKNSDNLERPTRPSVSRDLSIVLSKKQKNNEYSLSNIVKCIYKYLKLLFDVRIVTLNGLSVKE